MQKSSDFWAEMQEITSANSAKFQAEAKAPKVGVTAMFAGTCAKSGHRFRKGARIESTMYGWALVGAELDIMYNMTREDSPL